MDLLLSFELYRLCMRDQREEKKKKKNTERDEDRERETFTMWDLKFKSFD